MQSIILAGGFGTRLKSLVPELPKPMAPIAGRPFLCWLLDYLERQGITEAVLCLHHLSDTIMQTLGAHYGNIKLHYSIEQTPLGTGGAIHRALQLLNPEKPVFALNGDSLVELDYRAMMQHHLASKSPITIASRRVPDCRRYSQLTVKGGMIEHYELYGDEAPGDISTGFYIISPSLFDGLFTPSLLTKQRDGFAESNFSFERDFLAELTPDLKPSVYNDVSYFIDIGVPEDYARAQDEIPAHLLPVAA